jgi:hypothetical protein
VKELVVNRFSEKRERKKKEMRRTQTGLLRKVALGG